MYRALYRKWRPQVFADVVGQEHITHTLTSEIMSGRHSHAYLFTGSRGTGKTTCAKIFAKAVNCEHPVNGDPCNECETCKSIDNGQMLDIVEIDAASNNSVDNIRDLINETNFTPAGGKYRVYIIDEVHMLSTSAFNALLKTLEEPPKHVKFVLATTEIYKMPATILSRCQRFDFKRITPEAIANRLSFVATQEGLSLEPDAAMLIARLADGALRDALSILDQCISHGTTITTATVNETVGLAGKEHLIKLGSALLLKDTATALSVVNELHNNSCDAERVCNELINLFRNLMICRAVKDPTNLIVCSTQELNEYKEIASQHRMTEILHVLNILNGTIDNLKRGLNRRIEMEMAVIKICGEQSLCGDDLPLQPVASTPAPTPAPVPAPAPIPAPVPAPIPAPVPVSIPVEAPSPAPVTETPAPVEAPVEIAEPEPIPEAISEPDPVPVAEPVSEQILEEVPSPAPEHVSLTDPLPAGEIPTNAKNALIREITTNDKALIGTLNTAKLVKIGESLRIYTDNVVLKHLIKDERHREAIYTATFMVLGEYLKPVIAEDDEPASVPEANIPVAEPAPEPSEPAPEPETIPEPEPEPEEDPLTKFVNSVTELNDSDLLNFNLFIEE